MPCKKKILTALGALFCCALWGGSTPIVKLGYAYVDASHVPSLLLWAGAQFVVAGLLTVGGYSLYTRKLALPKRETLGGVALISLLQTVLQYALIYIGLLHTTSVKGAILKSTDVFFVMLISGLLFKTEKLTVKKLLSCILGFAGIILMNLNGLSLQISPLGDGFVTLGILAYSFSVILTRKISQREDPFILSGYQMGLGGLVLLGIGLAFSGKVDFVGMLPIFLGLCAIYAVSYTVWTILLKNNPASGVTIYSFSMPLFGVLFSSLLLQEDSGVAPLSLAIALTLVCLGILLWGFEKKSADRV